MSDDPLPYGLTAEEFKNLTGYDLPTNLPPPVITKKKPGEIIYDKQGKDTGERESPDSGFVQTLKGLGSGLGQAGITTGPAMYGLATAGTDYLGSKFSDKPKSLAESFFTEDGVKHMQEYDDKIRTNIQDQYPGFTPEEVEKKLDEVRKHTQGYYDEVGKHLKTGLSFTHRWNDKINKFVGEERLPSEQTQYDNAMNIVGGLVPIPGSTVAKIASTGAGQVLSRGVAKIASVPGGKLALNLAEGATPLVINTPGASTGAQVARFGVNAGIQEGIDQTARTITSAPSFIDWFRDDDGQIDAMKMSASGVGALGIALAAWKMRYGRAVESAVQEGPSAQSRLEQNLPNAVDRIKMGFEKFKGDDLSLPENYLRGLDVPEGDVQRVRTTQELNTAMMPSQDVENYFATGVRTDGSQGLSPLKIREDVERLDQARPGALQAFQEYDAVRNRLFDEQRALQQVNQSEHAANLQLIRAQRGGDPVQIAKRQRELQNIQTEKANRTADSDPGLRPSLENMSSADARTKLNDIKRQFPEVELLHSRLRGEYKAYVDIGQVEGLFSAERARQLKGYIDKGLTHFEDNPAVGKTFLENKVGRAAEWWEDAKSFGTAQGSSLDTFRGLHERNPRKGYINKQDDTRNFIGAGVREPRPNTPYDPFVQYAIQTDRTTRAIANNRARHAFIETALVAPKNNNRDFVTKVGSFSDRQFDNPAIRTQIDSWLSDRNVPHVGSWKNGEFSIYRVGGTNGKLVRDALNFAPAATVPVLNGIRKLSQQFLTGAFRPAFVLKAAPWDAITTALFRDTDKYTFGPVSQLVNKVLQPGGAAHKIFTAAGMPVDLPIMVMRLLPTGAKRGLLALYAGTRLNDRVSATGNRMLAVLRTNQGVIGTLGQLPGGQKVIGNLAHVMARGYEDSWYQMMNRLRIGHANNSIGQLDDILKSAQKHGFGQSNGFARQSWETWKSILSAMHDTSKELYLSQNYKRINAAYHGAIPKHVEDDLINSVRKSSGDFQRHSASQTINAVLSSVRYGNVILQTQRLIAGSFKRDPIGTSMRIAMGAVVPKVILDWYMVNWDDAARQYYWAQPNDKRIGTFFVPRPDIFVRMAMGEKIPFDPRHVYEVTMAPETLPFTVPVIGGLLAMGFLPSSMANGAPVPLDVSRDMGSAMDTAFGTTSPAFIGDIAKMFGYDVKPGAALFRGDSLIQPPREQALMGANKDKMSPGSMIPRALYDLTVSLFGAATGAWVEGVNVGLETTERTKSISQGVAAGAETAAIHNLATTPYVNQLFPEYSKRFINTPAAEEVGKTISILKDGLTEQYKAEIENRPGGLNNRYSRVNDMEGIAAAIAQSVQNPLLADMISEVHGSLLSPKSEFGKLSTQRADLKAAYDALMRGTEKPAEDNVPGQTQKLVSPKERFGEANKTALKIAGLDQARYQLYQEEWKNVTDEYGRRFAQQFGTSLTPPALIAAVKEASRRASLGVGLPAVQMRGM